MMANAWKPGLVIVVLAIGLMSFVAGQRTSLDAREPEKPKASSPSVPAVVDSFPAPTPGLAPMVACEYGPQPTTRREVATIRMPSGTWVKEIEASPYGSGRLSWTFQGEQVKGLIELNIMGFDVAIDTNAEVSLSSNGTIYGIITSASLRKVRFNPGIAGIGGGAEELQAYMAMVPLVEPLINEFLTDLPFSYQFRINGDKLTIHHYRILLSGPNPISKLTMLNSDLGEIGAVLLYFQAIGMGIEGTYNSVEAVPRDQPEPRRVMQSSPIKIFGTQSSSQAYSPAPAMAPPFLPPGTIPGSAPTQAASPAHIPVAQ
jgi:hypothetical protein